MSLLENSDIKYLKSVRQNLVDIMNGIVVGMPTSSMLHMPKLYILSENLEWLDTYITKLEKAQENE